MFEVEDIYHCQKMWYGFSGICLLQIYNHLLNHGRIHYLHIIETDLRQYLNQACYLSNIQRKSQNSWDEIQKKLLVLLIIIQLNHYLNYQITTYTSNNIIIFIISKIFLFIDI
ncbi:unnamed protein product [Paramecium sonneborni]|uniref:Uncharacterized protein n=1 Tax=Paramecium sonneborni TaxID=65129 RepID=A0A8S1RWQ2_9CILI|nr:unnamed protein product [Paramecium sonneborni]